MPRVKRAVSEGREARQRFGRLRQRNPIYAAGAPHAAAQRGSVTRSRRPVNTAHSSRLRQTPRDSDARVLAAAARKARRASGNGSPAGGEYVARQEETGQRKPSATSSALGGPRAARRRAGKAAAAAAGPAMARPPRAHRPARLRRDISEILDRAGRGATGEIELEAAFGEDLRLEAGDERRGERGVVEFAGDQRQRLVYRLVRIAFGQQARERAEPGEPRERQRAAYQTARRAVSTARPR